MARLRDVPVVLRLVGPWAFAKRIYGRISRDFILTWASALAYAWLFAVFPFFIFLMSLIPYLPQHWREFARTEIQVSVYRLPQETADAVWDNIEPRLQKVLFEPHRGLLSVGLVLTIWAASSGMAATMSALDRCYGVDQKKCRPYVKQRGMAFLLTVVVAVLVVAVFILIPVGTIVTEWLLKEVERGGEYLSPARMALLAAWQVVRYGLGLLFMLAVLALIYYYGPGTPQRWHLVTPGAVFSILVWGLMGLGFRIYVDNFASHNFNQTYGSIGAVVILLFFFYISAVVLLIGAEINGEIDDAVSNRGVAEGALFAPEVAALAPPEPPPAPVAATTLPSQGKG
jgi:membrane protein